MIDRELSSFIQQGLGIHIGTRDEHLQPNGARALAVLVEDDGRSLQIFVARVAAARILRDLESNGQVAVVFGRPIDDRACQVKGTFLGVREATEEERAVVLAQWQGFLQQLEYIGIPAAISANWLTWPAVVIRVQATAVFEQTPGPQAGTQVA